MGLDEKENISPIYSRDSQFVGHVVQALDIRIRANPQRAENTFSVPIQADMEVAFLPHGITSNLSEVS